MAATTASAHSTSVFVLLIGVSGLSSHMAPPVSRFPACGCGLFTRTIYFHDLLILRAVVTAYETKVEIGVST